jgi:SH3-like domain-containing protein
MLVPDHAAAMVARFRRAAVPNSHCPQAIHTVRTPSTSTRWLRGLQKVTLGVLVATALSSSGGLPHTAPIEVQPATVHATITVADSMRATGRLVLGQPRVATTTTGTVTAALLYLREGPGTTYAITGQMPRGTKLVILAQQPSWYKVRTPMGYVGWASSQYIAPSSTPPPPPSTINLGKYPTQYTANNGYVYTGRRAQVLHHVKERFSTRVTTYASHADCPTCSADLWTPDARGGVDNTRLQSMNTVAEYLRANASALGIKHIIWNQRLSIGGGAWQEMADRGSVTANHKDHVHFTFVDSFR